MKKIPLGATWEARSPNGALALYSLSKRFSNGGEIWVWEFSYNDGSGHKGDHATNRATVLFEARWCLRERGNYPPGAKRPRFKRIK